MAKSPLIKTLRRAYQIARMSLQTGIPADEAIDIFKEKVSRRRLLHGGLSVAAAATAIALHDRFSIPVIAADSPVLVVGAGIAGLTAAYRLHQAGVPVQIIEARERVGGRIHTLPDAGGTNIPVELGGEFIDSGHKCLRHLATELGLTVVDLFSADEGLIDETWYFAGRKIPAKEIVEGLLPLAGKIERDLHDLGDRITYKSHNRAAFDLDRTSMTEYLSQAKISPLLQQMISLAYTTEYGREAEEQSCLNLLFLISFRLSEFSVYGESDERYHIMGGNQQVPQILATRLANSIETETVLESIRTLSDGRYSVSLRAGGKTLDRTYERILLALPFTILRQIPMAVDMHPVKQLAIKTLGYGTNSKLITAYGERVWRTRHQSTAEVLSDLEFQTTWEPTRYAGGASGLVTNFTGGRHAIELGKDTSESQAEIFLPQFDRVFPGLQEAYRGQAIRAYWPGEKYTKAGYSCYLVGQWTKIAGAERERVGNIFFAGEHCSLEAQGYMEGACETGEAAAREILADLGLKTRVNSIRSDLSYLR